MELIYQSASAVLAGNRRAALAPAGAAVPRGELERNGVAMTTQMHSAQPTAEAAGPAVRPTIKVTALTKIYGPRGGAASSRGP